ncbi:type II CRISPR-associated endonuclease Cas1 [bacterium]|nr:type II CRISPR-associated endonuclease Cas1 [bacterium]
MAWRTVVVSNPAKLRVQNDQLVIQQQTAVNLPVEDISVLVLESPEVTLSSALLDRLAQHGVTLFACDRRHLPSLIATPFASHSRLAGIQRMQLDASIPFQKRCWQTIIKRKIANQARCLELLGNTTSKRVGTLVSHVLSGDSGNAESTAARVYFQAAFGLAFNRSEEDTLNHALNYGYAIMRGAVARGLTGHGFITSLGIHHRSELNQFNLADDFIEPLRPVVDLCAANMSLGGELTKSNREKLVALLHADVLVDGKCHAVHYAAELMAASFLAACREKDARLLKLPQLLPLKMHEYE